MSAAVLTSWRWNLPVNNMKLMHPINHKLPTSKCHWFKLQIDMLVNKQYPIILFTVVLLISVKNLRTACHRVQLVAYFASHPNKLYLTVTHARPLRQSDLMNFVCNHIVHQYLLCQMQLLYIYYVSWWLIDI